jgi:hypothetical protein
MVNAAVTLTGAFNLPLFMRARSGDRLITLPQDCRNLGSKAEEWILLINSLSVGRENVGASE